MPIISRVVVNSRALIKQIWLDFLIPVQRIESQEIDNYIFFSFKTEQCPQSLHG